MQMIINTYSYAPLDAISFYRWTDGPRFLFGDTKTSRVTIPTTYVKQMDGFKSVQIYQFLHSLKNCKRDAHPRQGRRCQSICPELIECHERSCKRQKTAYTYHINSYVHSFNRNLLFVKTSASSFFKILQCKKA